MATPEVGIRIRASGSDEIRAALRGVATDAEESFGRVDRSASVSINRLSSSATRSAGVVGSVTSSVTGLFGLLKNAGDAAANAFAFGFSKVVESSGQLAAGAGIAGVGLTGLVYAARTYTQSVAEAVSSTGDLADQLALPIDQLTRLQAAFRVEGGDGEKFGQGLISLKGKVVSLAEGNQAAIDSFSQLGLTMQNLRDGKGNLLGTRAQLDLVLDRIQAIKNPTLQAKAVMDLFGKSSSDLGGLISKGAAGLREAEKDVDKYGTVVDESLKDTFEEALGSQAQLTESLKGLGLSLTRIFFPFFADSSEGLSNWLNTNRPKIEKFLEGLRSVAEKVKADLVTVFTGGFGDLFSGGRRQAATWWVDCAGSVTIQIADQEPVDGLDEYVEEPTQADLVTIWIVRNKGANIHWPADWMWSTEVRGGAIGSDNPFAAASQDAQIDAFTAMRIPNRGTFAFVCGRKFS